MEIYNVAIIPLIIAIGELIKKLGVPTKFMPLVSLALGIGAGFLTATDIKEAIITGLFFGLSASGLYSSTKNVTEGITNK